MAPITAVQIVLPLALMYTIVLTLSKNGRARRRTVVLCAINILAFLLGAIYFRDHLPWQATWSVVWVTMAAAIASMFIDTRSRSKQA